MVQSSNGKEFQRSVHNCFETHRQRNLEAGRIAKELLN